MPIRQRQHAPLESNARGNALERVAEVGAGARGRGGMGGAGALVRLGNQAAMALIGAEEPGRGARGRSERAPVGRGGPANGGPASGGPASGGPASGGPASAPARGPAGPGAGGPGARSGGSRARPGAESGGRGLPGAVDTGGGGDEVDGRHQRRAERAPEGAGGPPEAPSGPPSGGAGAPAGPPASPEAPPTGEGEGAMVAPERAPDAALPDPGGAMADAVAGGAVVTTPGTGPMGGGTGPMGGGTGPMGGGARPGAESGPMGGRGPMGAEGGRGEGGRGEGARGPMGAEGGRGPGGRGEGGRGEGGRGPMGAEGGRGPGGPGGAAGRGPGGRGGGEAGRRRFGEARRSTEQRGMGAQDAPAAANRVTPAEPATLRESVTAVQPRREELIAAVLGGYDADRARSEVAGLLGGLGERAEQHKSSIREQAAARKDAIRARLQAEIDAVRAAAEGAIGTARSAFAEARDAVSAGAAEALDGIETALAADLAAADARTTEQVANLQVELGRRAEGIIAYGEQKEAEPAQIIEQEAQRAERDGRAAAADARQRGAARARTFGRAEPGPDQGRAVLEISEPTARDMESRAADLGARTRQGRNELAGQHREYASRVATSIREAGPAVEGALRQQAAQTRAVLQQGAEQARAAIQGQLESQLAALSEMEAAAVAQAEAGAAEAEARLGGAADAACAAVDEAATAGQAEVDGILTETNGALSDMDAPNPEGAAVVVSGAEDAMAQVVEGGLSALDEVSTGATDALGEAAAQVVGQLGELGSRAVSDAARVSGEARSGFAAAAQRRQAAATGALDALTASQGELVAQALAEIEGADARARGEMDARNAELRSTIGGSVNEGLAELRAPLGGLDGRMQSAANAVMEEYNKPWYQQVLSGLWNAVVGLVKGLVVLVVVALVVAAIAAAFGVALTAFGAMMIAGALLLAGGFIMACMQRSEQLPDAGWGEIGLIALQDTLGITGIREAATGNDMVTGERLNLEQRTERGTLGAVNLVMMAAGVRGGFRTTPWTRPVSYPRGMAGVRALGGDLVAGGRETAGALVDRAMGRRPSAPETAPGEGAPPAREPAATEPVRAAEPAPEPVRPTEPARASEPVRGNEPARAVEEPVRGNEPARRVEEPARAETEPVAETPRPEAARPEPTPEGPRGPQRTGDLDALYAEAADAQVQLGEATRAIAAETNGRPVVPETLKGRARAQQKIDADYGGDASRVTDLARSSVEYESYADLQRGLDAFRNRFEIVRVKNRFENPTDAGYRDVLVNLKTENGHVVEVQLHMRQVLEVKNGPGHALYEQVREIEARAAGEGRPLTAEEVAAIERINAESRVLYEGAMQAGERPAAQPTAPAEAAPAARVEFPQGERVRYQGEDGWQVVSSRPNGEVTIANESTGAVRRVQAGELQRAGAEQVRTSSDAGPEVRAQSPTGGAEQVDTAYVNRGGNQRLHVDGATDPALQRVTDRAMGRVNRGQSTADRVSHLVDHVANDVRYNEAAQQSMYRPTHEMPRGEARLGEMIEAGAVVCREKAVFTHRLLAEMGIESRVVTGNVKVNGPQGQGSYGHAWVELVDGTVVDGTWGQVYPGGRGYPVDTVLKRQSFYRPRQRLEPAEVQRAMDQAAQTLGDPRALDALRNQDPAAAGAATPAQSLLRPGQDIVLPERSGGLMGWLGRRARGRITRVERDMVFVQKDGVEVMYPRADVLRANGLAE